ncbi:radical SAM protein [Roseobacter sp. HKCCA0434]|uniref:radical SAM protein n=1 Tax=Roseobacter sp. HKCCA0434 TaxID=3079297 RepID=UPI002905E784|nr:radical SAM protein [Roseobacter sp. HKCCA0434]
MASSDDPFGMDAALAALDAPGARTGLTSAPRRDGPRLSLRDHDRYVSLTMEFRCNLACEHCMIEGTMDRLRPTSDDTFARVLEEQERNARWDGLVLTGSEITLRRDLPDLARRARDAGFAHVRIQTHGMHLSRPGYADRLIEAGVDEFFVSVAGSDAESHDRIVQVRGAWDKMMRGLAYLDAHDHVRILTNTVVTTSSYPLLPGMVAALSHLRRLVQHEFWTYFPMAERDEKGLAARHANILPYLRDAIDRSRELGRFVEVKNFPECLLGAQADALVNAQPLLVIDEAFWQEFDRNEFHLCPHRAACRSTECLGLSRAYVAKYGNERHLLTPLP